MSKKGWTLDRVMHLLLTVAGVGIALSLVYYLRDVLFPFFAAFLLAYIVDPLVNKLQKKVKHRIIAVLIVLVGFAGIVTAGVAIFVPQIMGEIQYLGQLVGRMVSDTSWMAKLSETLPAPVMEFIKNSISWQQIADMAQNMDLVGTAEKILSKLVPGALGVLSHTAQVFIWLGGAAVIVMYLIFIMLDMPKLRDGLRGFLPNRYKLFASSFASEMDKAMGAYFRSQTLVALCVGVLFAIAFSIMGLPMGILFGLLIGALNLIPYMQLTSIPLALLLGIVYTVDTGMPFWEVMLIITAIYLGIQILQDFVLVPKIVGGSMNLPPVGILLSLSIWGKLLGFLGLLVAIPFTCLCLVYVKKIQKTSEIAPASQDEPAPKP